MNWVFSRVLLVFLVTAAGGLIGMAAGSLLQSPAPGALMGGAFAAGACVLTDSLRGERFIRWLRGQQDSLAPQDAGIWGEASYRVERLLRALEQRVDNEQDRIAQFFSAIEASPNGVMLLDFAGQIEWCNSVSADHFGLDPKRDRRQQVTNLVRAPVFVAYMQSHASPEPITMPGSRGRGTLSVLIRTYGEGMKLVLSQDITERERNDAMRRDFVSNVSHEIRTPLTVLSGFVETMASLPLSEVEQSRVLELMLQQTQRMQSLVGDLLALAQLEGSPRPGADRWVMLAPLFARIHSDALALSAGRHTVTFQAVGEARIAGAEGELLSAISNLVNNAVRYTPAGGTVDVHWRLRSDGVGEIEVVDSGVGIATEHLPRLAERFYRVDGSRSRDTGGTGLGLSIVKHVVQRHGGELEIRSEAGKGSSFKLEFPASRVEGG